MSDFGLGSCKIIHPCCFKPQVCGPLFWQRQAGSTVLSAGLQMGQGPPGKAPPHQAHNSGLGGKNTFNNLPTCLHPSSGPCGTQGFLPNSELEASLHHFRPTAQLCGLHGPRAWCPASDLVLACAGLKSGRPRWPALEDGTRSPGPRQGHTHPMLLTNDLIPTQPLAQGLCLNSEKAPPPAGQDP